MDEPCQDCLGRSRQNGRFLWGIPVHRWFSCPRCRKHQTTPMVFETRGMVADWKSNSNGECVTRMKHSKPHDWSSSPINSHKLVERTKQFQQTQPSYRWLISHCISVIYLQYYFPSCNSYPFQYTFVFHSYLLHRLNLAQLITIFICVHIHVNVYIYI